MIIPLYKQELPWSCFATYVKMILEHHGVKKSERDLRILLKTTPSFGTLWEIAEREIKRTGFELIWKKFWDLEELKQLINQDIPLIVGTKGKIDKDKHAVVLVEISEEYDVIVDPENGELVKLDVSKFLEMWDERNNIAGFIKKI